MSLAVQYAVMETSDIDSACREIVDMYLDDAAKINKHKFSPKNLSVDSNLEDAVVDIARDNINELDSYNPNIIDIGYIVLDELKEDINTEIRDVDRQWQDRYIVIDKENKKKVNKEDSLDKAINFAEYKAKNNNRDYEIHIEKYDKYNTSLEAEVFHNSLKEGTNTVVLLWLTDTDFTLDDNLDFGI